MVKKFPGNGWAETFSGRKYERGIDFFAGSQIGGGGWTVTFFDFKMGGGAFLTAKHPVTPYMCALLDRRGISKHRLNGMIVVVKL